MMSRGAMQVLALVGLVGLPIAFGAGCRGQEIPATFGGVSISASTTAGIAPLEVAFSSSIAGGWGELTYEWTFGDGETSNLENPVHVFEAASETPYVVVLKVTDEQQRAATASIRIAVASASSPSLVASAAPLAGSAPLTVDFACDAAGGNEPVTVSWSFGDGTTSTITNVSHTYIAPGIYRATCAAVDVDGDVALETFTIQVGRRSIPQAFASASPTRGRAPLTVVLNGTAVGGDGDLSFAWNLGDGEQASGETVTHTYSAAGTYTAVLTVTDSDGDYGTASVVISVDAADGQPIVTASATPLTGRVPLTVDFDCGVEGGNAPVAVVWSFGDGSSAPLSRASHTFTEQGVYTATCQATDVDGDMASESVTITVAKNRIPNAIVSASPVGGPAPLTVSFVGTGVGGDGELTYEWVFGDGETATGHVPSHTYTAAGVYSAILTVTDEDGDSASADLTITVLERSEPVVRAQALPTRGVAPLHVQLNALVTGGNEPLSFLWHFGDGDIVPSCDPINDPDGSSSSRENPGFVYSSGIYTARILVTSAGGDVACDTVELTVDPDLEPKVTSLSADSQAGRAPHTVELTCAFEGGNQPNRVEWSFGEGTSSTLHDVAETGVEGTVSVRHTYASPGVYMASCSVVDADGDTAQARMDIVVGTSSAPVVSLVASPSNAVVGQTVHFTASVGGGHEPMTIDWSFGDGATISDGSLSESHVYGSAGARIARVTVTDADGNVASATATIDVSENSIPVVSAGAIPQAGEAPLSVQFRANVAFGNAPLSFMWHFGDGAEAPSCDPLNEPGGSVSSSSSPAFVYSMGSYTARVVVTDANGDVACDTVEISVTTANRPPVAVAEVPEGQCAVPTHTMVVLDASQSHDPDGDAITYQWEFVQVPAGSTARLNNSRVVSPTFVPDLAGEYALRVFVSDGRHLVGSNLVTIEASWASSLPIVGDYTSEGTVGDLDGRFGEVLTVQVLNSCGASVPYEDIHWWSPDGAHVWPSWTTASHEGVAQTTVEYLGQQVGPQTVVADLASDSSIFATFHFTAEPGPAVAILMEEAEQVVYGSNTTLHFATTDGYLNPAQDDVHFDLTILDGAGEFDHCGSGSMAVNLAMVDGRASVELCAEFPQEVYLSISVPEGYYGVGGWQTFHETDFSTAPMDWHFWSEDPHNMWSWGEPSYGDLSAYAGENALGTALTSPPYRAGHWHGASSSAHWGTRLEHPFGRIHMAWLEFAQYRDFPHAGELDRCGPAALLEISTEWGSFFAEDESSNLPPYCPNKGWTGATEGWVRTSIELPRVERDMWLGFNWQFMYSDLPASGAGWYIDDIRIHGVVENPMVTFLRKPAEAIHAAAGMPGTTCPADAWANVWLSDGEGRPAADTWVRLELGEGPASFGDDFFGETCDLVDPKVLVCRTADAGLMVPVRSFEVGDVELTVVIVENEDILPAQVTLAFEECPPPAHIRVELRSYGTTCPDDARIEVFLLDEHWRLAQDAQVRLVIENLDAQFVDIPEGCDWEGPALHCWTSGSRIELGLRSFEQGLALVQAFLTEDPGVFGEEWVLFEECWGDPGDPVEICFSGEDEDGNGYVDCEDHACWEGGGCNIGGECTGPGSDAFACRCVADAGCDDINGGFEGPFICRFDFGGEFEEFACAPRCDDSYWEMDFGVSSDEVCMGFGFSFCDGRSGLCAN